MTIALTPSAEIHTVEILANFGDVHKRLSQVESDFRVTPTEYKLLQMIISALPRPGWTSHLTSIFKHSLGYFSREARIAITQVCTAFSGLVEKGILIKIKGPGKRIYHQLSLRFAHQLAIKTGAPGYSKKRERRAPKAIPAHVDNVDKSASCSESLNTHVQSLETSCSETLNTDVQSLETSCSDSLNAPLYIEGLSMSSPERSSLSPLTSSCLPTPPAVDIPEPYGDEDVKALSAILSDERKLPAFLRSLESVKKGERLPHSSITEFVRRCKKYGDVRFASDRLVILFSIFRDVVRNEDRARRGEPPVSETSERNFAEAVNAGIIYTASRMACV